MARRKVTLLDYKKWERAETKKEAKLKQKEKKREAFLEKWISATPKEQGEIIFNIAQRLGQTEKVSIIQRAEHTKF